MTVDVKHLACFCLYRDPAVDLRHPGGENRQLQLRHSSLLPQCRRFGNYFPGSFCFPCAAKTAGTRSGDLMMETGSPLSTTPMSAFMAASNNYASCSIPNRCITIKS